MSSGEPNSAELGKKPPEHDPQFDEGSKESRGGTKDFLAPMDGPELMFGLVAPIGTDLKSVTRVLQQELDVVGYKSTEVHVTDSLRDFGSHFELKETYVEEKYNSFIKAGNDLRKAIQRQDAFALLAVAGIRNARMKITKDRGTPAHKVAYILSQFKKKEEIETLRRIYGRGFIQISAHCDKNTRWSSLASRIAASHYRDKPDEYYKPHAYQLIVRDESEEENPYGQRVRDTFPLADVIIDCGVESDVKKTTERFVRCYFGDNFVSPSPDEFGIYLAHAAALRSVDLSRQVGCAILGPESEVVSLGCNEVPKADGGLYWEGDLNDSRDFQLGYDSSVKGKREVLQDIFRRLKEEGWFNPLRSAQQISDMVEEALFSEDDAFLKDAQINNILEFGRIVHAEMAAITAAARLGRSLAGATLYCTTFPCHICARHIVAAGIRRVVYLEPYSKSLAAELYRDSISIEDRVFKEARVKFDPFIGIAPARYEEIFSKGRRKDGSGRAVKWTPTTAKPLLKRLVPAYLQIESVVLSALSKGLNEAGLTPAAEADSPSSQTE